MLLNTPSDTHTVCNILLHTRQAVSEKSNTFFIPFFPHLISYPHISTVLFLPSSEIQANPERADGSQRLLEILSVSYIFHSNTALGEPVGGIQKSNLWFNDACPL